MSKFKRCKELGLNINGDYHPENKSQTIYASDLEALLEKGVRVYGQLDRDGAPKHFSDIDDNLRGADKDTHTALLIGIKPIVRESEERQLLREFIQEIDKWCSADNLEDLADNARALLEQKK